MRWILLTCVLFVAATATSDATSLVPKIDNTVVALDLRSGRILWRHKPKQLGYAHFELHKSKLVVFPHYDKTKRTGAFALSTATGRPVQRMPHGTVRASSKTLWPLGPLRLANGWRVAGVRPGNSKSMHFEHARTKRVMGRLNTGIYYDEVAVHNNTVIYADSYLAKNNIIIGHDAARGVRAWSVDLNRWIPERDEWSRRKKLQMIGNRLYVQSRQHLFAFNPANGKLIYHRDMAADLKLSFHSGLVIKGGYALAVFAKTNGVLIISYNGRVAAYDERKRRYLWHMNPRTQAVPFPVARGNRVYLIADRKAKVVRIRHK